MVACHIKVLFMSVAVAKGTLSEETVQLFLRQIGTLRTVLMYCVVKTVTNEQRSAH